MSIFRRLACVSFCSMLSLATSLPAWADAPIVIGPIHDEGSAFLADCGAFQIIDDYDSNFTVRRMRDRNGTVIRLIEEVWGVDNFRNSVTGYSIPGPYHNNTFVDLQSRTAAIAGIIFRAQVPGVGSVVLDLGRVIVDREDNVYFSAGPHQFLDGDIAALCAALE